MNPVVVEKCLLQMFTGFPGKIDARVHSAYNRAKRNEKGHILISFGPGDRRSRTGSYVRGTHWGVEENNNAVVPLST